MPCVIAVGQHERLERRAGLAVALGGEVELPLARNSPEEAIATMLPVSTSIETSAADGPPSGATPFGDRLLGYRLQAAGRSSCRPCSPPLRTVLDAVALDQLLLDVVEEVRLADRLVAVAALEAEPVACERSSSSLSEM